jgi:anti-sigma factor RsiW
MTEHPSDAWIHQFLDGEIDVIKESEAVAHLRQCSECAGRLSRAESLFTSIESISEIKLDRTLAPAVVKRVRSETGRSRVIWRLAAAQAGIAVIALALIASNGLQTLGTYTDLLAETVAMPLDAAWTTWLVDLQAESLTFSGALQSNLEQLASLPSAVAGELPWLMLVIAGAVLWLLANGLWIRQDAHRAWPQVRSGEMRHG